MINPFRNKKSQPEPELYSPLPFHPTSNGEYIPWDYTAREVAAEKQFMILADEKSRRLGWSRRDFLESSCGMATALLIMNQLFGCKGQGDAYAVNETMTYEPQLAGTVVEGTEFIFDGQTHHDDGTSMETYIERIFVNSDTAVSCLSVGPVGVNQEGICHRVATRELVKKLSGSNRMVIQKKIWPNLGQAQLDGMEEDAALMKINCWKTYPHEGNWEFDDPKIGIPFIEKADKLGVRVIAAHKGLGPSSPRDLSVVAAAYPQMTFICYHSGVDTLFQEGPYNGTTPTGSDRLIKSYLDNQVKAKGDNLYADIGSVWNMLKGDVTQVSHLLGKLLKYLGPDRICWGTDAIYTDGPQAQIAAFRAFNIPQAMQDTYGYPSMTSEVKAKILGLNAARIYGIDPAATLGVITKDAITKMKALGKSGQFQYQSCRGLGPRTRREFFAMLKGEKDASG